MSPRVENKLAGREKSQGFGALMSPKVILSLVLIGIFSFGALIALSGFAGDLRDTNNGQAHALSKSAIGYAGIVQLLRSQGQDVTLQRTEGVKFGNSETLHVLTFTRPYQLSNLKDWDVETPTLIVLPKWRVIKMPERTGWVKRSNLFGDTLVSPEITSSSLKDITEDVEILRPKEDDGTRVYDIKSRDRDFPTASNINIEQLQTIKGDNLVTYMTAQDKTILAQIKDTRLYVLSDPDFLNTAGISTRSRAKLGNDIITGLIDYENTNVRDIVFDLNIHGFGRTQNLVKTLLTPPFLAATLCLLAAGALVAWQAFSRFGDPLRTERNYALGKYTLADNGARFIRIAGKQRGMAAGYLALIKRLTAKDFYLDKVSNDKVDAFVEAREDNLDMKTGLGELSSRLENAQHINEYLDAARALYEWRQEITHDR